MTTATLTGHVVVATDGSEGSLAAVRYAARAAEGRGVELEVVHVVPPGLPAGPFGAVPDAQIRRSGNTTLRHSRDVAVAEVPDLEVVSTLLIGSRVDALVWHTHDAAVLVLGAAPHGLVERLWTGSVVTGIAARATCPVAIVPLGAHEPRAGAGRRIVVGLKSTEHAEHLLGAAFALARQTQSDLTVVHAWHLVSPYDDAIAERTLRRAWLVEQERTLEDALIDHRLAFPEVQVDVDLVHGQAAFALVGLSRTADILMISRPGHGGLVHYLGSTARAVIRDAECVVEVVPPLHEEREHDGRHALAGARG
ncbi:universal stress protein [Nocardioides cynanchi]|uniref:universal stress protein n=1 Tax=Nocardioides cynanchi TaxID=2558918 RepID=UPI001243C675|nr:universal stress protein [Nocardioides cynanchi]